MGKNNPGLNHRVVIECDDESDDDKKGHQRVLIGFLFAPDAALFHQRFHGEKSSVYVLMNAFLIFLYDLIGHIIKHQNGSIQALDGLLFLQSSEKHSLKFSIQPKVPAQEDQGVSRFLKGNLFIVKFLGVFPRKCFGFFVGVFRHGHAAEQFVEIDSLFNYHRFRQVMVGWGPVVFHHILGPLPRNIVGFAFNQINKFGGVSFHGFISSNTNRLDKSSTASC
ncbi:MAG: hypothetical protein BWX55_01663 [Deltaproteobacteria bacterium ADurb.Bin022]|nr:MAG: hypothetical protein BWX55_01663 [Deltaproteobacteria bacterium ADurb.Bin022]